jgi:hypothetical protein
MMMKREAFDTLRERARRLGINTPDEAVTHAISVWFCLTTKLLEGGRFLIQRGDEIREMILEHPARRGEPLVHTPYHAPAEDAYWLGDFEGTAWWYGSRQRGEAN